MEQLARALQTGLGAHPLPIEPSSVLQALGPTVVHLEEEGALAWTTQT